MTKSTKRRKPAQSSVTQTALPVRTRNEEWAIRAAACAAFQILSLARRHNPDRPENYITTVCHLLYALLRAGFPRTLPVPKAWNRSSISDAEKRFDDQFAEELTQIERQVKAKRRPTQPQTVTRAIAMLPRARSGNGPLRAKSIFSHLPPAFQPIHRLMIAASNWHCSVNVSISNQRPGDDWTDQSGVIENHLFASGSVTNSK